jgi:hypothetical protein
MALTGHLFPRLRPDRLSGVHESLPDGAARPLSKPLVIVAL